MNIPGMSSVPLPGFGMLDSSKMRISAFKTKDCALLDEVGGMDVPYNPASIVLAYKSQYELSDTVGAADQTMQFREADPGTLTLQLIFDSTLMGNEKRVDEAVAELGLLIHKPIMQFAALGSGRAEPPYLKVDWGCFKWQKYQYFVGRASDFSASYSLFDANGIPQRAHVRLHIVGAVTLAPAWVAGGPPSLPRFPDLALLFNLALGLVGITDLLLMLNTVRANYFDNFDDFEAGDLLIIVPGHEEGANLVEAGTALREEWE